MIYADLVLYIIGEYIGDIKEASFNSHSLKGALSSITHNTVKNTSFKLYKPITYTNSILIPFHKISNWMDIALALNYNLYIKKYLDIYIFNWAMNAYNYDIYKSIEPFTEKCDQKFREKVICYRAFASSYFCYQQFYIKCQWKEHFVQLCKEAKKYKLQKHLPTILKLWELKTKTFNLDDTSDFFKYSIQSNQVPLIQNMIRKIDFKTILNREVEQLLFECLTYNLLSAYTFCLDKVKEAQPYLLKSVNTYSDLYQILKKKTR